MTIADHQTLIGQVVYPLVRPVGNVGATGAIVISWMGVLTPILTAIATTMAILWYTLTLYESKTCQKWIARRKDRKAEKPSDESLKD